SLATYALSRIVSKTHKVALAGDGGDEAFAGYKKYRILPLRDRLDRLPRARDAMAGALRSLPLRIDRTRRASEWIRTAHRLATGLGGDDAVAYAALTQVTRLAVTAPLIAGGRDAGAFERMLQAAYA